MIEKRIKLCSPKDKMDFLKITNSLNCDVDIRYGGRMFDAKSELSVLSLDNRVDGLKLRIHSDDISIINMFSKWFI